MLNRRLRVKRAKKKTHQSKYAPTSEEISTLLGSAMYGYENGKPLWEERSTLELVKEAVAVIHVINSMHDDVDYTISDALLYAPCRFCGYEGRNYWQPHSHNKKCVFYSIGGITERREVLENAKFIPVRRSTE